MTVKVVLDAGHGGRDNGAAANGLREKDLVLQIALQTRDILRNEYEGVTVVMTRTTDVFLELSERAFIARNANADAFVSIHLNAFNGSANGIETFMHSSSTASAPLRRNLHNAIKSGIERFGSITDRGLKSANFAVLRLTYREMFSALTESLFIDNTRDAQRLKNPAVITAIARGHAEGIATTFNLRKKGNTSSNTNAPNTGTQTRQTATVKFEGKSVEGFIHDGRTYAPARATCDMVGATIRFNSADNSISIDGKAMTGGMRVDGVHFFMVRTLAETLDLALSWDAESKTATLSRNWQMHTVASGETLWSISQKYGTTVTRLVELNQDKTLEPLSVGLSLRVK